MIKLPKILKKPLNLFSSPTKSSERLSDLGNPAAWLLDIFNGVSTLSGENSTHETALTLDAYFAAARNISEDIAKLPFNIFKVVEKGMTLTTSHPSQNLIHRYANPCMSTMSLFETVIHWALSYGNGYAEIVRNSKGQAVEMWPIHPSRVKPFYAKSGKLFYEVHSRITIQGQENTFVLIDAEDVFNLRGLGADGIQGYSIFVLAANAIATGIAIQKFASVYFNNGTALSGILSAPGKLSKEAYQNMRESWAKIHEGSAKNKHKVAILEGGTAFSPTSSTAQEAQLLESQKYTVIKIARLLRIPPHKLGEASGLVKANLEAESISYFRDTLMPWIKRISLEADRKIIKNPRFTATYQVDALTMGDSKTRAGVFKTHRNMGTMSINDVLRLEGQNVLEEDWANEYHMQSNVTTVKNISEGANLKPKGNGQNGKSKLEGGEKDPEGRDPEASAVEQSINTSEGFEAAKEAHFPSFLYAAKRVVTKESKMLEKKLSSMRADSEGFEKWARHFFQKQKADIIDVFEPCCHVFTNTFAIQGIDLDVKKIFITLSEFSEKYAEDGIARALSCWFLQSEGGDIIEKSEDYDKKMATSVINLIVLAAKGQENEVE